MNVTWAYVAGFFDGEGTIMSSFRPGKPWRKYSLWFPQTDREVLDAIQAFFTEQGIRSNVTMYRQRGKMRHKLSVCNIEGMYVALNAMYPHLIVKRAKAEEAMEVIEADALNVVAGKTTGRRAAAYENIIAGSLTIPA